MSVWATSARASASNSVDPSGCCSGPPISPRYGPIKGASTSSTLRRPRSSSKSCQASAGRPVVVPTAEAAAGGGLAGGPEPPGRRCRAAASVALLPAAIGRPMVVRVSAAAERLVAEVLSRRLGTRSWSPIATILRQLDQVSKAVQVARSGSRCFPLDRATWPARAARVASRWSHGSSRGGRTCPNTCHQGST